MAGMLPGVESARRRRFHQTGGGAGFSDSIGSSTRRSSFCLYSTNFASHHNNNNTFSLRSSSSSTTTTTTTSTNNNIYKDEELGGVAKDAKHRLDERLKAPWKSHIPKRIDVRSINGTTGRGRGDSAIEEQEEEVIPMKNGGRKLKWGKSILGWRSLPASAGREEEEQEEEEEEECVICLEGFKNMIGGESRSVMQIACGHRFHSRCLLPWLHSNANAHCPCCRMPVTPALL